MKPKKRTPEQDDLLRPRLVDIIDMRHELVKLATLIDWEFFEDEWGVDRTWWSCGAFSVCDGQPTIENCGPCDGYLVSPFGRPTHPSALSHAGIGDVID